MTIISNPVLHTAPSTPARAPASFRSPRMTPTMIRPAPNNIPASCEKARSQNERRSGDEMREVRKAPKKTPPPKQQHRLRGARLRFHPSPLPCQVYPVPITAHSARSMAFRSPQRTTFDVHRAICRASRLRLHAWKPSFRIRPRRRGARVPSQLRAGFPGRSARLVQGARHRPCPRPLGAASGRSSAPASCWDVLVSPRSKSTRRGQDNRRTNSG